MRLLIFVFASCIAILPKAHATLDLTPEQILMAKKAVLPIAEVDKDHIFIRPRYASSHQGWLASTYDIRKSEPDFDLYRVVPIPFKDHDDVTRVAVWVNVIGYSPTNKNDIVWGIGLLRYLLDINSKNEIVKGPIFNIEGNLISNEEERVWVRPDQNEWSHRVGPE